ncbi:hypothetical protein DPSP01_011253 [Paraphaeosphaeria sporulosa]
MPGQNACFYEITSTSIPKRDQLILDSISVFQSKENSTIPALVIRTTPCTRRLCMPIGLYSPPMLRHLPMGSFRAVGGAVLSCPIQSRSGMDDELYLSKCIWPTDFFAESSRNDAIHSAQLWLV